MRRRLLCPIEFYTLYMRGRPTLRTFPRQYMLLEPLVSQVSLVILEFLAILVRVDILVYQVHLAHPEPAGSPH